MKQLGSNITFPIEIDSEGRAVVKTNTELINSSIAIILNWPDRTRFFNGDFGSRVEELIEEPDDVVSMSLLKHFIIEALSRWEKRITVNNVLLTSTGDGKIDAKILYTINATNAEESFIFPFYKNIIN